jgi:hypothetical protein
MVDAEIADPELRPGRPRHVRALGTPVDPAGDWVRFGAVMMVVVGAFSAIEGVFALAAPATYTTVDGTVLAIDLVGWAWLHMVLGVLVFLTGLGLLRDAASEWARVAGVAVIGLSMFVQLAWLPATPIWSIVMIALGLLVLGALLVTGNGQAEGRR